MFKSNLVDNRRVYEFISRPFQKGTVIYWMSREQRIEDNWALLFAYDLAKNSESNFIVVFCLLDEFLNAHSRNFYFMLEGLLLLNKRFEKFGIPFLIIEGNPIVKIPKLIVEQNITTIVTDFDPLKIKINWKTQIAKRIQVPFYEIDTHNIVPCRIASQKQEWSAYTFRPKIKKLLNEFLVDIPKIEKFENIKYKSLLENNYRSNIILKERLRKINAKLDDFRAGSEEGLKVLKLFIEEKLPEYHINKNNPSKDNLSNLSPYLHFGMISSQRVALEISKSKASELSKNVFLEELIIRKELSDNYCFYNKNYDNIEGFPDWAKNSLYLHRNDKRDIIYSIEELEFAKTKDPLWNFSQDQLLKKGKIHGYLRMYWAKKLLEWTSSPEQAQEYAIYLNDKYSLDGRDPNGYTGIAWSIGGVHDRPWKERNIYGKIRYMSYENQMKKLRIVL